MGDPSHLEKMGRELNCPICLSLLNSAVSLTCNHVFCNSCIMKSMKSVSNCPVCKVPFRRREVRAAPHMDSLVNIYKSMEAASGFQIFVTQNPPSTKFSDENKKAEDDTVCPRENTFRVCRGRMENERSSKRKGARKAIQSNLEVADPIAAKPSFPTKKRVQVPQCLPSETPTQHEKLEIRSGENTEDEFEESSLAPKENSVSNRKGEHVLSPFFWLRDDEGLEKLSQQDDGSQLLEVTPPYIPVFSDIQDSDDESPSKLFISEKGGGKSNEMDFFDSEMFEWTQRPCSPELSSSPIKMKDDGEADGIEKRKEAPILNLNTNESIIENEKSLNTELGMAIEDEELPVLSHRRTKGADRKTASNRSKKRGRIAHKETLKKCFLKDAGQEASLKLKKKSREDMQEEARNNKGISLNFKEPASEKAGNTETVSNLENMPHISIREEIPKIKDKKEAAQLPGMKQCGNEDLRHRINGDIAGNVNTKWQIDCSTSSKKRKVDSTDNNIMDEIYTVQNPVDEDASPSQVDGKNISDIQQKRHKRQRKGKEVHSASGSKSNKNLRCKKNIKVSFHGISGDKPINDQQEGQSRVSTKETKLFTKLSNVSKETKPTDKAKCSFGSRILENSVMMGKPDQPKGVALHACQTFNHTIQCAFCLSSEDAEVSGEMVHYCNGRSVAANYNGGLKVIHVHRNCAEWAPNVYFEDDTAVNLEAELTRSKRMKCCCCGLKGAALGCYEKSCRKSFHVTCAKMTSQCRWDTDNFVMLCPLHASCKLPNEDLDSQEKIGKKCSPRRKKIKQSNQVVSKQHINKYPSWNSSEKLGKLVFCCSALTIEEKAFVAEFQRSSGVTVLKTWDLSVTHVIASTDENGACRRTLKILMGILEGKWILNIEWVKACLKAKKFVQEEQYEITNDVHGVRNGPLQGRLRILNKQPKIFEGLKFYLMGDFIASYKGYIQDIIVAGGGTILHRKPISGVQGNASSDCSLHSTFIIYSLELPDKCDVSKKDIILNQRKADAESLATATGAKVINNSWVLNSVAACKLQSFAE